jgi:hypothetical protein
VVVADDNYLLRQGVVGLLDAVSGLEVVGVAGSARSCSSWSTRSNQRRHRHPHPHAADGHRRGCAGGGAHPRRADGGATLRTE